MSAAAVAVLQRRAAEAAASHAHWALGSPNHVQQGWGKIRATVVQGCTRLTQVGHKAPARCIPLRPSASPQSTQAAICVLSNYGGGMVQGDRLQFDIHVQAGATLGLTTQGSNRIYKHERNAATSSRTNSTSTQQKEPSQTVLNAIVEENACLVVAPDPVSCFRNSKYRQISNLHLKDASSSVCWIDWFSAGRLHSGERWQQEQLESHTTLTLQDETVLMDSLRLHRNSHGMDWGTTQFNAFASIVLYGPQVSRVWQQSLQLQSSLVNECTRTRPHEHFSHDEPENVTTNHRNVVLDALGGRAVVGVSHCPLTTNDSKINVVRLATTSNEDMYRLLHHCLLPLTTTNNKKNGSNNNEWRTEFYKDRIRSTRSAPYTQRAPEKAKPETPEPGTTPSSIMTSNKKSDVPSHNKSLKFRSPQSHWNALILADSALPVGSFAHSAGLEAAQQNQLIVGSDSCASYIHACTKSTLQWATPLVRAGHQWACHPTVDSRSTTEDSPRHEDWKALQSYTHANAIANETACRASLDQGRSLLRVISQWQEEEQQQQQQHNDNQSRRLVQIMQTRLRETNKASHLAPIWGVVCNILGVKEDESCHLFGYCVARDMCSAAVRLNLMGPLASVPILASMQESSILATDNGNSASIPAGCAPIVDAIQPNHDILSTRLFRT